MRFAIELNLVRFHDLLDRFSNIAESYVDAGRADACTGVQASAHVMFKTCKTETADSTGSRYYLLLPTASCCDT